MPSRLPLAVRCLCLALALALASATARPANAEALTVFAAASLKTALDDVAGLWRRETGTEIAVSYAGSSALARQIEAGAPADLFISANPGWMDRLEADGFLRAESRRDLLTNSIVLIAHGRDATPLALSPDLDLSGLIGDGRLAMALVDAVPAGIYGKAALETLELWEQVAPKVAQADNVRAALALVAIGEAPFGIVYATDALAETRVSVAARFPADTHPPILYPAAVTADSDAPDALPFLAFLESAGARAIFERHGFSPAP
ncbi:molybdate ABC transporter substrate-binding protein [Stappia stellulata]|uniref:molybdate ABC transporter substrate-binding protein n=1 Tax=Stappia stellulata TaxID=71235 RepID=UPI00041661EE|nr:molybdate ABC transporter substrate-binding protein [Stappia stellulata]